MTSSGSVPHRRGDAIVVEEWWRGRGWSAEPHRGLSHGPDGLVTFMPSGSVGVHSTNRGLASAEGLTRDQRKMTALQDLEVRQAPATESLHRFHLYRPGRWARVGASWRADGEFIGWYVNCEVPAMVTPGRVLTKDLILDLVVAPDHQLHPKDEAEFERAVHLGVVSTRVAALIRAEVDVICAEVAARSGPFSDQWAQLPTPIGPVPQLPASHRPDGSFWSCGQLGQS